MPPPPDHEESGTVVAPLRVREVAPALDGEQVSLF